LIVTVTLNPSLLVDYAADKVELGTANKVSRIRYRSGGRGLAVARLLTAFGHEVVAAGLAGGSAGELIRAELARAGVPTQFTRISAESRRVVLVADAATRQITSLEEPAPYITTEELGRLAADYRALLDGATAVVLCGSLPAGLPAEIYGSLISYASGAGVPVVLDAGGSPLRHGAARRPALVIPDLTAGEVGSARHDRTELGSVEQDRTELARIESRGASEPDLAGAEALVLQAASGVRVLTDAGEWLAGIPPLGGGAGAAGFETAAQSRPAEFAAGTGFRDALVAGFVPGIALAWSWPDMLRHAVALAASVLPSGEADLAAYEALLPLVAVTGPVPAA
jgi:1-phosphofructokinase family hexose kinase